MTHLKPGDIIYEPNGAFIGDLVGHIAMVYDIVYDEANNQHYVITIESYTGGVQYGLMTPARFESKDVQIYRLTDATETQIQGAIAWAQSQYDAAWFFKAWKKTEPGLIPVWYCAELIWAAYYHQGIYLDQDDNNNWGSIVFPYEIAAYQNAIPILHDSGEDYQAELYSNGDTYHTYYFNGKTYTEEHDYEEYQHRYRKCRVCEYIDYNTNNLEYQEISNTLHSCECTVCGHIFYEEHTIKYTIISNENHSKNCIYCGYTLTEVHNYQAYNSCYEKCADCGHKNQIAEHDFTYGYETNPNDVNNTHYAYCECGLRISQEHSFSSSGELDICTYCHLEKNHIHSYTYRPAIKGKTHIKECRCGEKNTEACFGAAIFGEPAYCGRCGEEMKFGGIGILSNENEDALLPNDDEDYLE